MVLLTTQSHKSRRRFPAVRMSCLPRATVPLERAPRFLVTPATIYATLPVTAANNRGGLRGCRPDAHRDQRYLDLPGGSGHSVGTKRI
jgi:hypothetical protein